MAYDEAGKDERQVVDIGLNVKNFTKKVHIANYVRFIAPDQASNTIFSDLSSNPHGKSGKHVRKHWEYSEECFNIIKEYNERFPEVMTAIQASFKRNKAMNSIFDLYPNKKDKVENIKKLREILNWIENLPIAKLSYVEMGFDALDQ